MGLDSVRELVTTADPLWQWLAVAAAGAIPYVESYLGAAGGQAPTPSARRLRLKRRFDRFGVPGVSLLGQTLLPSQITSAAMVGFGADTRTVVTWQTISIIVWGAVFGTLAAAGLYAVA